MNSIRWNFKPTLITTEFFNYSSSQIKELNNTVYLLKYFQGNTGKGKEISTGSKINSLFNLSGFKRVITPVQIPREHRVTQKQKPIKTPGWLRIIKINKMLRFCVVKHINQLTSLDTLHCQS
jgi:hypothetical protein